MVSRSDDAINFDKLEAELNDAVDADERYQRENDAKFRAVNQRVATYEEFRYITKTFGEVLLIWSIDKTNLNFC